MGNQGLFPGVAVPLAFFCTLFFRHRKKSVSAPWNGKSHSRAGVGASSPGRNFLRQSCPSMTQAVGLSSGQTIGAARTAVRSACCLPELRVISAFGGQPTGLIFPSVPPCTPSVSPTQKPIRQVPPPRRSRRVNPHRGIFTAKLAFPAACRGAFKISKRNHPKLHRCRNQHELPLK